MLQGLHAIAEAIESYVHDRFFDAQGVVYAYLDAVTGKPFERDLITAPITPRRAGFDPWAFWTYEDSVQNSGVYLEALVRKFEITGDAAALGQARRVWAQLRNTYYCSQVFGIGSFLRPYGGYEGMSRFAEPLGTDQASPMFAGAYRLMKHVEAAERAEMTDILRNTIAWYERQGFRYFYYKFMVHEWNPAYQHAASFYLPAIAWAGQVTGEAKWQGYLNKYLGRLEKGPVALDGSYRVFNLYRSMYWAGDLPVLKECLGDRFEEFVTPEMIEHAYRLALADLAANYSEPGVVKRYFKESADPGFKAHVAPGYDRGRGMGFVYFATVHQGRSRPRLELHALCGLAAIGHRGAFQKAVELLAHREAVPTDFTDFLFEDHESLPPEVHLYARSVGAILFEWCRDYWLLRGIEAKGM